MVVPSGLCCIELAIDEIASHVSPHALKASEAVGRPGFGQAILDCAEALRGRCGNRDHGESGPFPGIDSIYREGHVVEAIGMCGALQFDDGGQILAGGVSLDQQVPGAQVAPVTRGAPLGFNVL